MRLLIGTPTLEPKKYIKPTLLLPDGYEWLLLDNHETGYPIQDLAAARNYALEYARRHNFDQLLFLDSDVHPPKNAYELLNNTGGDLIFGWTFLKAYTNSETKSFGYDKRVGVFFAAAVCMLIKEKLLQDTRLTFSIVDPSGTEDANYSMQTLKLGYCLANQEKCYCTHRYNRDSWQLNDVDLRTLTFAKFSLNFYFPNVFFWHCKKQIKPEQIEKPRNLCNTLPHNIFESGRLFVVQIGREKYGLLSGKLTDGDKTEVLTPSVQLQISPVDLFKIVSMTDHLRSQFNIQFLPY